MPLWVLVVIALWPVAGLMVLSIVNWRLRKTSQAVLPVADRPGEILGRMYLWPIICWRVWSTLHQEPDKTSGP